MANHTRTITLKNPKRAKLRAALGGGAQSEICTANPRAFQIKRRLHLLASHYGNKKAAVNSMTFEIRQLSSRDVRRTVC